MKHTPGPWEVLDFGDGPQVDSGKGPVAVAVGYKGARLANARLIAAAPGLHQALVELIRWAEAALSHATEGNKNYYERSKSLLEHCQAAIAKAEGK